MGHSAARTLLHWEISYFFHNVHQLLLVALLIGGILLAMWPHVGSAFVPVILVAVLGTEREYNNMLNRWPSEHAALLLLPLDWRAAILAKNLATVVITLLLIIVTSIIILYFAPLTPSPEETLAALLWFATVLFPLLASGNARSLHSPRPGLPAELDDLPEAVISLVVLAIASIPFGVLWGLLGSLMLTLLYVLAAGCYWLLVSVPRTARAVAAATLRGRNLL